MNTYFDYNKIIDIRISLQDIMNKIKLVDGKILPHSEKRELIDKLIEIDNILAFNIEVEK